MNRDAFPKLPLTNDFLWSTGIEDTFIATPHKTTGRVLEEYLLTEHYDRWKEDLDLCADLGVPVIRYGIPWYRVNPTPGVFDWSWSDQVVEYLVTKLKVEPIVDLIHYGTPLWLENSFFSDEYPERAAEYAEQFARHYKGACYWYTPLNEPRVNAWYAGRLGWWPPHGKSWKSFVKVMTQIAKGICLTQQAIAEVERDATFVHVDASDLFLAKDPSDAGVVEEMQRRQELVFLALDLVMGRLDERHHLWSWLLKHGMTPSDFDWFSRHAVTPDVIGFNMYPMFSKKEVLRRPSGRVEVVIRKCWTDELVTIAKMYGARYREFPIMVTETACSGSIARRIAWIQESSSALMAARDEGLNLMGYVFWPLFSLITWAYQGGAKSLEDYIFHMGLYDLTPTSKGLERVSTPAVQAYKDVIQSYSEESSHWSEVQREENTPRP